MNSNDIEQLVNQDNSYGFAQLTLAGRHIKCVFPMTFSQKMDQFDELKIAEEYEQALEANSLEKIKSLLNRLVKLGD